MIQKSDFKPAWWCRNRHLQTLYPALFRKPPNLDIFDEVLELPDGDFLDLVWTENPEHLDPVKPLVILLHGLEGSIRSSYAKSILHCVKENQWTGLLMHFRGCSGRPNRLDRSYHSGETGDIHFLLSELADRFPQKKIAAVGISLGGNVLLKYLGEQKDLCKLTTAMAISVPFDLADGARTLDSGFAKIYQRHLIKRLVDKLRIKFNDKPAPIDLMKLGSWKSFYLFDHNVTAVLHGFDSADDYYTKSSSRQYLREIKIPTLILHSRDDPFMSYRAIPEDSELSDSVILELSNHGGHLGFIHGKNPVLPEYWAEKRMVDFFKNTLS